MTLQQALYLGVALLILALVGLAARRIDKRLGLAVFLAGSVYMAGALLIGEALFALHGRQFLAPDERSYVLAGRAIVRAWAQGAKTAVLVPDGFPYVAAWTGLAWSALSSSYVPVRVMSAVCGASSLVLIYLVSLRCFDRRAARLAVALALLTPSLALWSMLGLKERLLGLLALSAALATTELIRRSSVVAVAWLAASVYGIGFVRHYYAAIVGWPLIIALVIGRSRRPGWFWPVVGATLAVGAAQTIVTGTPFAYGTLFESQAEGLRASLAQAVQFDAGDARDDADAGAGGDVDEPSPFMTGNDQVGDAPSRSFAARLLTTMFGRFRSTSGGRIMSVLLIPDWLLAFVVWPCVVLAVWDSWLRKTWLWLVPAGLVGSMILAIALLPADSWAALRFRIVPWPLALTLAAGGAVGVFDRRSRFPAPILVGARWLRTRLTLAGVLDRTEASSRRIALESMAAQRSAVVSGPRILMFSLRGWAPHVAWDSVVAHALRLRGADVHMFTCGGPMPACEVNFRGVSPAIACAECRLYPEAVVGALGFAHSRLASYVSAAERRAIELQVAALRADELEGWRFDDRPIGQLVQASVLWFLRKRDIDVTGADGTVYRRYLVAGAQIATAVPRLLDSTRPDVVVEVNGQFFAERILHTYVPPSTRVVAYEAGWRLGTLGFDEVSERGPVDLDDAWARFGDRPLTDDENDALDKWMGKRLSGDMQRDFYINFNGADGHPLAALGLDPDKPTAVLFTNLVWDTAVIGRDLGFRTISDWVRATVSIFAVRTDWQLVIRIHPAEDLRPGQETVEKLGDLVNALGTLPPNIRLVESSQSVSSYALIDACRATLVYTSTIGFEAAMRGSAVVLGARVYYRGRGFTVDVDGLADYGAALERVMAAAVPDPTSVDRARRFAHLLLFRYLHRVPVVLHRPGRFPIWATDEVEELVPGRSAEFDCVMDAILTNAPFV